MKRFFLLMMLIASSCAKQTEPSADVLAANEAAGVSNLPSANLYSDGRGELIKTADIRFQVTDLKKSREDIDSFIRKYSAFIAASDLKYENPVLEEHLTIRVLSLAFEPLLKDIEHQAAYVNYRKISSDDVEKEFVDLESRLKSKREMQQRYADIVRSKARTTEDLLKAEHEIGKLHEEIEAVVTRINFLRDQVRYSTIKLEIYQVLERHEAAIKVNKPLANEFSEAFSSGWVGLNNVLIFIVRLWPLILLGIGGWACVTLWKMKRVA